jgi:selenocysteine lyase/cysteine desulfurase
MLNDARKEFDIPREIAFFNSASLTPMMRRAREAGQRALLARGAPWSMGPADWFDAVERRRALFAELVGACAENIAFVPASSYGLAIAARNLSARPGQRIVVISDDYPSNVYTWRRFCLRHGSELFTVPRSAGQSWTEAVLAALDERVAIAALPNVHWTDGSYLDLAAISQRLRSIGAALVVDASQSLGAMPFDFSAVQPDFLVAVGYKWLLGPFGLGYLYVADRWLGGEPLEENWISREGSEDFARLVDYRDDYRPGARRFDVGERSLLELTPVANAVLETTVGWSVCEIAEVLRAKTHRIASGAAAAGLSLTTTPQRGPHILGVSLPQDRLAEAFGVLRSRGVFVGVRGSALRIAPHVFNDAEDLERLLDALERLAARAGS